MLFRWNGQLSEECLVLEEASAKQKQHLLAKKNTKQKLRLSKMHAVSKSDYDNVIGAVPYLKVNRQAT
ncbi:hypothetical protein MLD38_000029 [Melastoma candidum]|uniref:Uncharacterized protein n=1 Tax=Melastoma candidum TaxID=119954 RepID=A0ACB9S978_9MYRT|nr:hypothetical protein MLD38_000029 [Melastoma candidum]